MSRVDFAIVETMESLSLLVQSIHKDLKAVESRLIGLEKHLSEQIQIIAALAIRTGDLEDRER